MVGEDNESEGISLNGEKAKWDYGEITVADIGT